jgi:restriction endonuclease S subunit
MNSQGLTINSKDENLVLDKYLWYYLEQHKKDVYNCGRGSAQKAIDMEKFKKLKIPVPSLNVQQDIVDKLDFLYEKDISSSNLKIEQLKKQREFLVHYSCMGYEKKELKDLCEMKVKGTVNSKSISNSGEYPFYKASVTNPSGTHSDFCFDGTNYILFVKSGGNSKNPLSLSHGIGKSYLVNGKTCGNSEVVCINATKINKKFLFCLLRHNQLNIQKLARYSTNLGHIDMSKFRCFKIPVPPFDVQQNIVQECEKLDQLISSLEENIEKTKQLAKTILTKSIQGNNDEDDEEIDDNTRHPSYDPESNTVIVDDSDNEEIEED